LEALHREGFLLRFVCLILAAARQLSKEDHDMSERQQIDLSFRPDSYWATNSALLNVKGEIRRREIQQAIEDGRLDEIPEAIQGTTLPGDVLDIAGKMDPQFMGGEYLPDYKKNEVEIARVALDSTTCDVTSVRARKSGDRIRYRVLDEYETEYCLHRQTSVRPLTLGQLIDLMESSTDGPNTGLVKPHWPYQEGPPEEAVAFTTVSSVYYPQLADWYEQEADKWVRETMTGSPSDKFQ
jgi:hypothetical protein